MSDLPLSKGLFLLIGVFVAVGSWWLLLMPNKCNLETLYVNFAMGISWHSVGKKSPLYNQTIMKKTAKESVNKIWFCVFDNVSTTTALIQILLLFC